METFSSSERRLFRDLLKTADSTLLDFEVKTRSLQSIFYSTKNHVKLRNPASRRILSLVSRLDRI